jgi:hypothetical protein
VVIRLGRSGASRFAKDAAYQAHPIGFMLDFGKVYAYVGALGQATGNATHMGIEINNTKLKPRVFYISGDKQIGSASEFARQVPNSDKFIAYYRYWRSALSPLPRKIDSNLSIMYNQMRDNIF